LRRWRRADDLAVVPAALPQAQSGAKPGSRWEPLLLLGVAALIMAGWVVLLALGYGLGTCGEDSELTAAEYERLCGGASGGGGVIAQRLVALTAVAAVVVLAAGVVIWLRRARWAAVGAAAALLLGLALLGLALDA
jgi:hypothetical protein